MSTTSMIRWIPALLLLGLASASAAQSDEQRAQAARSAATTHPACTRLPSFYWEIGDGRAALVRGTWGVSPPAAATQMNVYSASKWVYGAYVYELRGGQLDADDLRALRMLDGYTQTSACALRMSVGACSDGMAQRDPAAVGKFHYASGQFQQHASVHLGLANATRATLTDEVHRLLGRDWTFMYQRLDLAGGGRSSAADYAVFLRKLLNRELRLSGPALGSNAVCTYTGPMDPATGRVPCDTALYSPAGGEAMQYSIGHFVETDPVWRASGGDAAFSSPGLAGFYPWIDESRTYYGVLARDELAQGSGGESVACGRQIRKAWLTATAP